MTKILTLPSGKTLQKLLVVAPLWMGSTSLQRLRALQKIVPDTCGYDTSLLFPQNRRSVQSIERRLAMGPHVHALNREVLALANHAKPDLIWCDKSLLIWPETLVALRTQIPSIYLVHYSPDDQLNPRNQSRHYRKAIGLYDAHITTKLHNVEELKARGARRVIFQPKAYSSEIHRPLTLSKEERARFAADVSFIGHFEAARAHSILFLARHGIRVRVWGPGWEQFARRQPECWIEKQPVWGAEYARAINASHINLCFLRKENKDTATARSVEIPACGAFMLAERTPEHLTMFTEDKEASYFSSDDELLEKIEYYLARPELRNSLAKAGLQRCITDRYSNEDRLRQVIEDLCQN